MSDAPSCDGSSQQDLDFLGLGNETPQYDYQGMDHFRTIYNHENNLFAKDKDGKKSQYIVFSNVSERQFNKDFNRETDLTFESYIPSLQLLLVKMSEYEPHSVAVRMFEKQLMIQLIAMGRADHGIIALGTAHFEAPKTDRKKRADNAYRPKRLPTKRDSPWPTVVVEVGFSEPQRKLKSDAKWWLGSSEGHVRNVITISINRSRREITLEKWVRVEGDCSVIYRNVIFQEEPGAQKIKCSNPLPLIIGFGDLFLRVPVSPELDVLFGSEEFEELAMEVWFVQFELDYHH